MTKFDVQYTKYNILPSDIKEKLPTISSFQFYNH